jgi:hypothetical protein
VQRRAQRTGRQQGERQNDDRRPPHVTSVPERRP